MAERALQMVRRVKRIFKIDSKLQAPQASGPFIVDTIYKHSSAFGLTQGVHFFEAVVPECQHFLSDQYVQIGWSTRLWSKGYGEWRAGERHRIDEENSLQYTYDPIDDQQFIGFDGSFPSGTVLGCLLDLTQRTFAFFVNGQKVKERLPKECPISSNAYYVYAKGALQYCNFGQVPFKYPPPPEIAACPTTDLANQINRYELYKSVELMPLFENQVEPYFTDAKQGKVKGTLEKLWMKGETTEENVAETYSQLWKEERFHLITYGWRWLQALIEMENADEGKVNEWASLMEIIVHFITDEKWFYLNNFIVPYSKLREREDSSPTLYRTLAILFAILLKYRRHYTSYFSISSSVPSFLFSAFLTTPDPITAMFTLIGLDTVKENIMRGLTSKKFTKKLKQWKGTIENTRKQNNSFAKLHLVIQHFEHSLLSPSALGPATPTSLSPSNCSSQAKLSSDCLSLRSDFDWQSACSHLSVDNSLSLAFPVFYFETTLLTSGPMRIGWATQRWQVETSKLGDSEFSFAYDGHIGCIWHQDVQWRVKNAQKWKAGHVIGCLLDLTKNQFAFYQNGERIETNGDIYSRVSKKIEFPSRKKMLHVYERNDSLKSITPFISGHPYHAALSLSSHQQVTVNFGHTFFRFPPKCLDFWDFQQYSEHLEVNKGANKEFKAVNISSATNSIISIQGKTTTGNFSVNPSDVSTNPTTESSFIILEPTVCQVCKQQTNFRRRTLEGCAHLAFCVDCSSKNLLCKECSQ